MDKKPIIFDYNNYTINENLKFKNPETRNNNVFIPIKYDNKSLLFKTPRLYMPFKPHINQNQTNGFVRLSFDNIKIDTKIEDFYNFIKKTEKSLKNKLNESNIINNLNINKSSKIKLQKTIQKIDSYSDYFNINFNMNELKVYDSSLSLININDVNGNFYAFFVIELAGFFYNHKTHTIKLVWNLLQFKLDKVKQIIDECLFLDEQPIEILKLKNHPKLEKFFKMIMVGVPKMAIQHKMTLERIDINFLDYAPDTNFNTLSENIKSSLEKDKDTDKNKDKASDNSKDNEKGSIKEIVNINKIIIQKKQQSDKKLNIIPKKSLTVPSLQEIQNAYKKLLKRNEIEI
jgi:hypothetical protein